MSEKMCTFAAALVIVPAVTIKSLRVMIKEDICKLSIGGAIYRVSKVTNEGGVVECYRVLRQRKICKGGGWFNDEKSAIMFMLRFAFNEVAQLELEGML